MKLLGIHSTRSNGYYLRLFMQTQFLINNNTTTFCVLTIGPDGSVNLTNFEKHPSCQQSLRNVNIVFCYISILLKLLPVVASNAP